MHRLLLQLTLLCSSAAFVANNFCGRVRVAALSTSPSSISRRKKELSSQLGAYEYEYIDDRDVFLKTCEKLSSEQSLAVDLEGEYNNHRYGMHLCLLQVATSNQEIYLIDPLTVGSLDPIFRILEEPDIEIISHGPQSDIVLLDCLYGCNPTNVFDTELAASLLGYNQTSLKALLQTHFGLEKNAKLSRENWNIRPLSNNMLDYAALDVACCHALKDLLHKQLTARNRLDWHKEECLVLNDIRHQVKPDRHLKLKGARGLNSDAQHVLKHLYEVREKIASDLDKPPYQIIGNLLLVTLAEDPPYDWSALKKGVHRQVRREAASFENAVRTAKATLPKPPDFSRDAHIIDTRTEEEIRNEAELLERLKQQLEKDYSDVHHLIIHPRFKQMRKLDDMKSWKRSIIQETAKKLDLDISCY